MPQINKLPASDTVQGGDLFAVYIQSNGDARKVAASVLLDYIKNNIGQAGFTEQLSVVASDGFNIPVTDNGSNIWLIINPSQAFNAGTITLPPVNNVVDGQEVLVFCGRQIDNLTVDGNGAVAVRGAPTALPADSHFKLRFAVSSQSWYTVG
jgi:hypothetical protein